MKKETKMNMAEAYMDASKSPKISGKQGKIAKAAKPVDKITGADFKALKKKGK
jgi:hypothetical protein